MEEVHELEAPFWAVVVYDRILLNGVAYKVATDFVSITAPRCGHKDSDLMIITAEAASRMRANKRNAA